MGYGFGIGVIWCDLSVVCLEVMVGCGMYFVLFCVCLLFLEFVCVLFWLFCFCCWYFWLGLLLVGSWWRVFVVWCC